MVNFDLLTYPPPKSMAVSTAVLKLMY